MSFQKIKGIFHFPNPGSAGIASNTNHAINTSGAKLGCLIQSPRAGDLSGCWFRFGTVSSGGILRASIQGRNISTGYPDGSITHYSSFNVGTDMTTGWIFTSGISVDGTNNGTKKTLTEGELFWLVFDCPSYTIENFNIRSAGLAQTNDNFTYCANFTTGWSGVSNSKAEIELVYSDNNIDYSPSTIPAEFTTIPFANNTAVADEYGICAIFPVPMKVRGAWLHVDLDSDSELIFYDTDGNTVIASGALKASERVGNAISLGEYIFPTSYIVQANTATGYRLSIRPTTTTQITLRGMDVRSSRSMEYFVGGSGIFQTSRLNVTGAWNDTLTSRPRIGFLVSEIHDGASTSTVNNIRCHPGLGGRIIG